MNSDPPILSDHKKQDEEVQQLTSFGHKCLLCGDHEQSLLHFQSALSKSTSPREKLSCLLNSGGCLVALSQFERGKEALQNALDLLDQVKGDREDKKDEDIRADILYNLAVATKGMGNITMATDYFNQSMESYIKAGNKESAGDVHCVLASYHKETGELDKQLASLLLAQQLYDTAENKEKEALTCADIATCYQSLGQIEKCKQMLAMSRMMGLTLNDSKLQGQLYAQIGLVYSSLKMCPEAIQSFEKALPLVRQEKTSGDRRNVLRQEAALLQNIGAVYNEMNQYNEAIVYHKTAASINGQIKLYEAEAKCLCNLAFAQTQVHDFKFATHSFSIALSKSEIIHNSVLQFQALEGLGSVCYHSNQLSKSISYFEQALRVLDEVGEETGMARERVMEKLSDVTEAQQTNSNKDTSNEVDHTIIPSSSVVHKQARVKQRCTIDSRGRQNSGSMLHPPLTPIPLLITPHNVRFTEGGVIPHASLTPIHDRHTPSIIVTSESPYNSRHHRHDDSYTQDLKAYINSYSDGSLHSSTLTSLTSDTSSIHLTRSAFGTNKVTSSGMVGSSISATPHSPDIPEGSLALGPNTKQLFTVQSLEDSTGRGKRRKRQHRTGRIVPISSTSPSIPHEPETHTNITSNRSTVCIIL